MDRAEFLAVLKKVSAALSGKDLIPIFSCLCFREKNVHAYDDVVALQFPISCGIRGGVRGKLLMDWLGACRSKEVEITQEGEQLILKGGRAKLETPVLPEDDFLFKRPDVSKAQEHPLTKEFLECLAKASVSIGRDPSHPWRLGVTAVMGQKAVTFYASNNSTAAKVRMGKFKEGEDTVTVVLPPRFVELLQDIGKVDTPVSLMLTRDWAEAKFDSGIRLFSRTISGSDVDQFDVIFRGKPDQLIEVPKGLARALERALVVVPFSKDPYTRINVAEGRVKLSTKSSAGNVTDAIAFEGDHPDQVIEVVPEHVVRGLPYAVSMGVLEDRIVLTGERFIYLISAVTRGGSDKEKEDRE